MHVLIIEDDAKTADFVAGAFRQSGYVCTICADGLFIGIGMRIINNDIKIIVAVCGGCTIGI